MSRNRYSKFSLLLILELTSLNLQAGHMKGASLTWECLGDGTYVFTVIAYGDCFDSPANYSNQVQGPAGAYNLTVDSILTTTTNDCNNGCLQKSWVLKTQPIRLSGTPPSQGWEFSYGVCCRAPNVNLIGPYLMSVSATMYPYTPPGTNTPLSADSCFSHSPSFSQREMPLHCEGPIQYSPQSSDLDADSLSFEWTRPSAGSFTVVNYNPGYSEWAPFPDSTENSLNGPVGLDPKTGQVTAEFYNADPGFYYATLLTKEYRNGQLLSETMHDFSLKVLDSASCAPVATNNSPTLTLSSNNNLSLNQSGSTYRTTLLSGDTIDLEITATDFDLKANGSPQIMCLEAVSSQINSSNYSLDTGCASPSCATIVPLSANNSYCGSTVRQYNFEWVPDCRMINNQPFSPLTYRFQIKVSDDACPIPKSSTVTILVDLYPGPLFAPSLSIDSADTSGNVSLSWTKVQISPTSPFDRYVIYHRPVGGTFAPLDSIYDIDSLQASYTNLPYPSQFFIKAFAGTCRYGSPSSDVLTTSVSIDLEEWESHAALWQMSPNPASEFIQLRYGGTAPLTGPLQVKVYNLTGALVLSQSLAPDLDSWRIPIQCKAGLFLVQVESGQLSWTERLYVH